LRRHRPRKIGARLGGEGEQVGGVRVGRREALLDPGAVETQLGDGERRVARA
jgi:hypothetical protein